VSSAAYARWQKYRKEAWKGTMSLPSFRGGSPIYVSGSGVRVRAEDGNAVLSIHLDRWRDVVVKVDGGNAHAALRRILDNPESIGDVRLIEDDDRRAGKRKWFAMLAYTFERPTPAAGRTMAVHRGMRNFLTIATARGERMDAHTEILETGEDIVRHKEGYRARRRSLGRQGRQLGFGAKGHGVDRRMERVTRLEDAEERWVQSKCREVAANLVRRGLRHGVTRVLLEDWSNPAKDGALELSEHIERLVRSFPFAKLRDAVEWAATKQGWTVELVETDYNSRDCPACGHRHDAAQIGTFLCGNCRLERSVDVIFAWNMLRRDAKVPGVEESKAAAKRAVRKLRASAAVS
jgi:transposase